MPGPPCSRYCNFIFHRPYNLGALYINSPIYTLPKIQPQNLSKKQKYLLTKVILLW